MKKVKLKEENPNSDFSMAPLALRRMNEKPEVFPPLKQNSSQRGRYAGMHATWWLLFVAAIAISAVLVTRNM